jgi:hypothetical protein
MTSIEVRRFKYNCDVILYGAQHSRLIISNHGTRGVTWNRIISTAGGNWDEQIEVRPGLDLRMNDQLGRINNSPSGPS